MLTTIENEDGEIIGKIRYGERGLPAPGESFDCGDRMWEVSGREWGTEWTDGAHTSPQIQVVCARIIVKEIRTNTWEEVRARG